MVGEVAVVRERPSRPAVLVRGLEAPLAERDVYGVGNALPVFGLVGRAVYGAGRFAAHVVWARHGILADPEHFLDGRALDELLDVLLELESLRGGDGM